MYKQHTTRSGGDNASYQYQYPQQDSAPFGREDTNKLAKMISRYQDDADVFAAGIETP